MPNPFMEAPVLAFLAMVASFALILGPIAAADLIRSNKAQK